MRDARPEGSPYPKADLWLRGLARGVDFLLAFALATLGHELGAILAVVYLLLADGLLHGQSPGKRLFGVRAMHIPKRTPAGYRESMLRNADFALVALFFVVPLGWILLILVGLPIIAFESWMVWTDRLGIRIGDIFADTQVVDGKVVTKIEVIATHVFPLTTAPPGSSATRVIGSATRAA
jgi:uncharacterized RDD family membrane protein YckC